MVTLNLEKSSTLKIIKMVTVDRCASTQTIVQHYAGSSKELHIVSIIT